MLQDEYQRRDPGSVLPRTQTFHQVDRGFANRLCRVDQAFTECLKEIDTGLLNAESFWRDYAACFKARLLGPEGVSDFMLQLRQAMSICFWLPDVTGSPSPQPKHKAALLQLYQLLKPGLLLKPWPPHDCNFTPNFRKWPTEEGLLIMYNRWWEKIHDAYNSHMASAWCRCHKLLVRPLRANVMLLVLATTIFRCQAWRHAAAPKPAKKIFGWRKVSRQGHKPFRDVALRFGIYRLAARLQEYLEPEPPADDPRAFLVPVQDIRVPGYTSFPSGFFMESQIIWPSIQKFSAESLAGSEMPILSPSVPLAAAAGGILIFTLC